MKKVLFTFLLVFISMNYAFSQSNAQIAPQKGNYKYSDKEEKRKGLWKDFHKIRYEYFGEFQDVNLYAENQSLTNICFICDKGLFIFYWGKSEGRIEKIEHAKFLKYDQINRITYDKNNGLGFFKLWHYEAEELSISAN